MLANAHHLPSAPWLAHLIHSMKLLDDAHAQPQLAAKPLLYAPQAASFAYRQAASLPLFVGAPHYRQVHFALDVLSSPLASLAAHQPQLLTQLVRQLTPSRLPRQTLYQVCCKLPQDASHAPLQLQVDGLLPTDRYNIVMGQDSATQAVVAWPHVLSKALLKLFDVLQLSQAGCMPASQPAASPLSWENVYSSLSGQRCTTLQLHRSDAPVALASAAIATQRPLAVVFQEPALAMQRWEQLPKLQQPIATQLESVLGGLALRLHSWHGQPKHPQAALLLPELYYSVLRVDDPQQPQRVLLYNPLGFNASPSHLPQRLRAADFFVPSDITRLPRVSGTFWLSWDVFCRLAQHLIVQR